MFDAERFIIAETVVNYRRQMGKKSYASIDHEIIIDKIRESVTENKTVLSLIYRSTNIKSFLPRRVQRARRI